MTALRPDFMTAFGMTAIAAWTVSWVMWVLGRRHMQQGMWQAILSTTLFGAAYACFALQSHLGLTLLQFSAKLLVSAATATFTIALQRFRQSSDLNRDATTVLAPVLASLALGLMLLPSNMSAFNRMQTVVVVLQTLYTLSLLIHMRASTPGLGWVLITVANVAQILSILPLVFIPERPSPHFSAEATSGDVLAMWAVCLMLYLKVVVSAIGFLIMLRDRQAALDHGRAQLDPLTQLPHRAALLPALKSAMQTSRSSGKPLAVMMVDIDHFKRFNDTHGHLLGDQVIRAVADILKQQSRGKDLVARYGGEEFVLLLPNTNAQEAQIMALRLNRAIRAAPLNLTSGEPLHVTVSIGIHSTIPTQDERWDHLLATADLAMYEAKREGRDRVAVASNAHKALDK